MPRTPAGPDADTRAQTSPAPSPDRNERDPPTIPANPDEISIGKAIQGKRAPSITKVAALGHLLGRESQALQSPGIIGEQLVELIIDQSYGIRHDDAPNPSELMRTFIPHP